MNVRNIAILLFPDVEVLDFAGPFEVFSVTRLANEFVPFRVYTVAKSMDAISTRNALSVNPHYALQDCPPPDVVVVPGGYGTRPLILNDPPPACKLGERIGNPKPNDGAEVSEGVKAHVQGKQAQ